MYVYMCACNRCKYSRLIRRYPPSLTCRTTTTHYRKEHGANHCTTSPFQVRIVPPLSLELTRCVSLLFVTTSRNDLSKRSLRRYDRSCLQSVRLPSAAFLHGSQRHAIYYVSGVCERALCTGRHLQFLFAAVPPSRQHQRLSALQRCGVSINAAAMSTVVLVALRWRSASAATCSLVSCCLSLVVLRVLHRRRSERTTMVARFLSTSSASVTT